MRFLKKANYRDIIGNVDGSQFHYYEDLTAKYKEFELFINEIDLKDLLDDKEECLTKLLRVLKKNGAVISAVHCPESKFKTCNESESELSENYLSLCEVLQDSESKEILKKVLKLADKISQEQSENENQEYENIDVDEEEESNRNTSNKTKKQIIVILHEGCEKGCIDSNLEDKIGCNLNTNDIAGIIGSFVNDLKIKSYIQIALENITPFYSKVNDKMEKGGNCGWKPENQKSKKDFFEKINKELKDKNIQFSACIDFCHIMVSSKIMEENKSKCEVVEEYFNRIDYVDYIVLFHVSNYSEDLSHGQLFSFENEEDKKVVELIRKLCNQYASRAFITFEMADGMDIEKAALNYEHIMFYFSNKHLFGKFSELLEAEKNKELKDFFDDLFVIYTYDKKSVFEITNALWRVKKIILENTFDKDKEERLFGVDFDKTKVNLTLVRLKAYVYYTRFCNLGNYLAENHYSGNKCIWNNNNDAAEDFGLAMKYFIFNDRIHQCIYTGIQYKFLIDLLPKKETFFRFNDGIKITNDLSLNEENVFKEVVNKIPAHISGTSIYNGNSDFFSVGKNFSQCLFKYFDSNHDDWTVRIYNNMAINYVDYNEKRYSIQAFTQLALLDKSFIINGMKIDLSLDISRFASGRDGKATDTLEGFLKCCGSDLGFIKENVASISDEEILFTNLHLQEHSCSYTLNKYEGLILKKICLGMIGKKADKLPNELKFEEIKEENESFDKELKELENVVNVINSNENHKIWKIVETVKENLVKSKNTQQGLEELNTYSSSQNDKINYEGFSKYIHFKRGEKVNE